MVPFAALVFKGGSRVGVGPPLPFISKGNSEFPEGGSVLRREKRMRVALIGL